MSAYVVNNETINCIVNGYSDLLGSRQYNPEQVGKILFEENTRSVNCRYNENEPAPEFQFTPKKYTNEQIFGCIRCWEYQACETDDYKTTEAFQITADLKDSLIRALLPETPWGVEEGAGEAYPINDGIIEVTGGYSEISGVIRNAKPIKIADDAPKVISNIQEHPAVLTKDATLIVIEVLDGNVQNVYTNGEGEYEAIVLDNFTDGVDESHVASIKGEHYQVARLAVDNEFADKLYVREVEKQVETHELFNK